MINNENIQDLERFSKLAAEEFARYASEPRTEEYVKAAELILEAKAKGNRLHITGIGKPSHVAEYGASLISSTGTPTYYLHGTEAGHGSCGQLVPGDVVICISNSGDTAELLNTARAIQNNGCAIIAVTGNENSSLAKLGQAHLYAGVGQEGGPLNRAPRASILAECFALQKLSVLLQSQYGLDPKQYVKWHPGGTLGHLRDDEK